MAATDGASPRPDARQDWAERLSDLRRVLAGAETGVPGHAHAFLRAALRAFGLGVGVITEVRGPKLHILAVEGDGASLREGEELVLAECFAAEVIVTGHAVADPCVGRNPARSRQQLYRDHRFETYLAAPIFVGGAVYGTISLMDRRSYPRAFDAADVAYLELFAQAVGTAVTHERLARERAEMERQEHDATTLFSTAFSHAPVGMALVGLDGRFLKVNGALCRLSGYSEAELLALTFQKVTFPDDLRSDLDMLEAALRGAITEYEIEKRYLHKDGHPIWTRLNVALVRDDVGAPRYFVSQIQSIDAEKRLLAQLDLRRKELEAANRKLTDLARLDPLTGVLNRRALRERLTEAMGNALARSAPVSFLMADVDHFKAYNDRFGHLEGDVALKAIAACLNAATREGDIIGRFGGEEFLIVLPDLGLTAAEAVAERMRARVEASLAMRGRVTISIGVHTFVPLAEPAQVDRLIAKADEALYKAKTQGRNRVETA